MIRVRLGSHFSSSPRHFAVDRYWGYDAELQYHDRSKSLSNYACSIKALGELPSRYVRAYAQFICLGGELHLSPSGCAKSFGTRARKVIRPRRLAIYPCQDPGTYLPFI